MGELEYFKEGGQVMKSLSNKSAKQQRAANVSPKCREMAAAVRNPVYAKTDSRRPAAQRNPRQRVKYC